ncbi:hypothetical protein [Runella zeae]|jgi:hypothetical protein|uniref:hypothetical protein n=1 Tax=Runella zeae TaxID=94255 RepID=UPI002353416A|nr:hypothetical protein [Runella zeae]
MSLKVLCILGGWLWLVSTASAQKSLRFKEQLTFQYQEGTALKEMSVYLDRKSSTWLFTNDDSFGGRAEGLDFVVAYANGKYLVCSTDDTGYKACQELESLLAKKSTAKISGKPTANTQIFGKNKYGWPTFKGQEYEIYAGRAIEKVFLTTVPFSCNPLYSYNFLIGIEYYLPLFTDIDLPSYLPKNQLVLKQKNNALHTLSPTEYYIDLGQYKVVK